MPIGEVVQRVAERRGVSPTEITTVILDRERHEEGVRQIREAGSRIRFITDGDVAAALLAVSEGTGVDLLWGIGGTPEGVISAAAIKCLGGQILGRLWPRDDDERQGRPIDAGYEIDGCSTVDDLVGGDDAFFAASGVTDGDLLQGVRYRGAGQATTESLIMRSRSGTVRTVQRPPRPGEAARGYGRALRVGVRAVYLIAGATGYVGGLLADELSSRGRDVRCMARSRSVPRSGSATAARSFAGTCSSRTRSAPPSTASRSPITSSTRWDAAGTATSSSATGAAPRNFAEAAQEAGVGRIIYLGGLGSGQSQHLRSREETAEGLASTGIPLTYFRAADRDRVGQRVAADDRLPRQAPAGDADAELDRRRRPSRSRPPTSSPTSRRLPTSRSRPAARSRSAATR